MFPSSVVWAVAVVTIIIVCTTSKRGNVFCNGIPIGFEDQEVARIPELIDISFGSHPDNNSSLAYGVSKDGGVYVILNIATLRDGEEAKAQQVLDLRNLVCEDGERGYVAV